MTNINLTRSTAWFKLLAKSIVFTWACCLIALAVNAEEIYRIEDKNGKAVFTDTPPPAEQAEMVELNPTNTQPALVSTEPKTKETETSSSSSFYTKVTIVQPANNHTITPGQLDVVVQLTIEPQLHNNDLVQFYMDGKALGRPVTSTSFSISNLTRGAHQIKATIVSGDTGAVIAKSNTVTIHVKRSSVQ